MAGFVELAKFQKVNYLDLEAHGFLKRIWLKIFPVVKFRLTEDLIYIDGKGVEHIVKKGFITDGGSFPRLLWFIFPPMAWMSSYCLHDQDCENPDIPRIIGDLRLAESLKTCGAPDGRIDMIYGGVRAYALLFGLK